MTLRELIKKDVGKKIDLSTLIKGYIYNNVETENKARAEVVCLVYYFSGPASFCVNLGNYLNAIKNNL